MNRLLTLVAAVLAGFVLAFIAAPWFALRGLQAAARDGDVHALAELVDYGAVRAGLRVQLTSSPSVPPPRIWEDPMGAVARAMQAPRQPDVDRYLTPSGLHALVGDPQAFPAVRHWGPNRVRFATGRGSATLATFQRRGALSWRLVQLHVPPPGSSDLASQ